MASKALVRMPDARSHCDMGTKSEKRRGSGGLVGGRGQGVAVGRTNIDRVWGAGHWGDREGGEGWVGRLG